VTGEPLRGGDDGLAKAELHVLGPHAVPTVVSDVALDLDARPRPRLDQSETLLPAVTTTSGLMSQPVAMTEMMFTSSWFTYRITNLMTAASDLSLDLLK